jgi:hypothetical protein
LTKSMVGLRAGEGGRSKRSLSAPAARYVWPVAVVVVAVVVATGIMVGLGLVIDLWGPGNRSMDWECFEWMTAKGPQERCIEAAWTVMGRSGFVASLVGGALWLGWVRGRWEESQAGRTEEVVRSLPESSARVWALRAPDGGLFHETAAGSCGAAWRKGMRVLMEVDGSFARRQSMSECQRVAVEKGYRVVEVDLVERVNS